MVGEIEGVYKRDPNDYTAVTEKEVLASLPILARPASGEPVTEEWLDKLIEGTRKHLEVKRRYRYSLKEAGSND